MLRYQPVRSSQSNREVRLQVVTKTFNLLHVCKSITSSQKLGICPCLLSFSLHTSKAMAVHSTFPHVLSFPLPFCISTTLTSIFFISTTHHDLSPSSLLTGHLASIFAILSFILQNNLKIYIHQIILLPTIGSHYIQDGTYRIWPATDQLSDLKKWRAIYHRCVPGWLGKKSPNHSLYDILSFQRKYRSI